MDKRPYFQVIDFDRAVMVYRSPVVYDSDPMFAPVLERVEGLALSSKDMIVDPDMMFGRAELTIYRRKD